MNRNKHRRIAAGWILVAVLIIALCAAIFCIKTQSAKAATVAREAEAYRKLYLDDQESRRADREVAISSFLRRKRCISAEELAAAIISVTNDYREQRILAAQAVKESHGNPRAVGAKGERGIWQVKESEHGRVPRDTEGQARQALQVLRDKTGLLGIRAGVERYNGTGPKAKRYATDVLAMAGEIR